MKGIDVLPRCLGVMTLHDAFDIMFGNETLTRVHGNTLSVSDWNSKNERKLKFKIDIEQIPREIRRFFCGNKLNITTKQQKIEDPTKILVNNKIKMHFLGAEFFHVKPKFLLLQDELNQVYVSGHVEHHAILPPPLNGIAEAFMAQHSKREMDRYTTIIEKVIQERNQPSS